MKKFDYLLGMSIWMLTDEKKNELLRQRDAKLTELNILKKKTNKDLWKEDLNEFVSKLDTVEEKERADDIGNKPKNTKKTNLVIFTLYARNKFKRESSKFSIDIVGKEEAIDGNDAIANRTKDSTYYQRRIEEKIASCR